MTRSKSADHLLVALMIALALFSSYSVFIDKYQIGGEQQRSKAGQVLSFNNSVKRKTSQVLTWFDTFNGDQILSGDSIFTYEQSQAEIQIYGSKISLKENTLIQITDQSDQAIDLKKGSVDATTSEGKYLTLTISGQKVQVGGSKAKIQIVKEGDTRRINVKEGKTNIKIGKKVIAIDQNQSISVSEGKSITQKPLAINNFPTHNSKLYFTKSKGINFQFDPQVKKDALYFEIADNFEFRKSRKLKVSRNLMKLTLNKERQFFWRVCSANLKDDQFCEVSQFEMIKERAPNIYSPEQNQTIYKNQEVEFRWEHPKAKDFIVQIIKNGKIESEVVLGEPLLNYTFDELGSYALNIKEASQRASVLNAKSKLITVKPLPAIDTVKLITPLPSEKLFFYHQNTAKIYFEWSNAQKLNSFDLKINDQIYKAERPNMTLELEEGRYQWSVAGEFKGINKGNFNEPSQFEIINIKSSNSLPQEGTVIELERPGDEVKFEWNGDNKKFLFEVSKSKDFNQIFITKETSSTSLTQSFSQKGTFFWRAKVLNSQGKTIYSPPKKVIIKPGSAPEPLKLDEKQIFKIKRSSFNIFKKILDFIIPSANAQSQQNDYSTSEGKIKIKWPKSVKAKEYLLEIYQDQNLTNKIFSTKTKDNFHLWEYEDHDKFFFRVAIIDYWDRQTSFSNLSEVELVNEYNPREAIQLEAPKHRMSSYDNEVEFEWDDQKYAKSYKLLIAKDLKFKRITKTITTDDTDFELKLPKSRYYWKVEAYDKDGMKINTSKRRIFSLKSRPKKIKNKEKNRLVNKSATKLDKSFNKHLIAISYAPSKFSLEETSTAHNVNIDGTFLNAISLFGKYESTLDYTLRRSSGKVFNDIGFQFIETSAIYHGDWAQRFLNNTFISIGPSLKMLKSFPLSTTTLSEMNSTLFALQVGVTFGQLQTSPFEINLATSIGSFSAFEGKVRTIISEKYFLSARFESGSYEEGASEISFSSMGLEIGSTFNW